MKTTAIIITLVLIAGAATQVLEAQTDEYDIIIANGRIVDGTGNPWFYADVAIRGDRIIKVGRLNGSRAKRQIDAQGLVVSPGFIDMLGQSEQSLLIDPRAESKVFQGITTEITGEGGSIAPLNDYILKELEPFLTHFKLTADWRTLAEYFARLERSRSAINLATYVGATQVRQFVLHDDNRSPTPAELDQMRKLVAQAMEDGAVGVSTSLVYAPAFYANTEELIELAKVAAHYGGVYASHMRNESTSMMPAVERCSNSHWKRSKHTSRDLSLKDGRQSQLGEDARRDRKDRSCKIIRPRHHCRSISLRSRSYIAWGKRAAMGSRRRNRKVCGETE